MFGPLIRFPIPIRAEGSLAPHTPHCPCPETVRSDFFHFFGPRWLQDAFKMPSRCNLFLILFLTSFFIDFYPNLAPTWPQLGPQIHPKTHPRPILERKSEKNPTKMGPKLITFNQHEPKDPQSRPRTPPCTSFSLIFDRFLMDF